MKIQKKNSLFWGVGRGGREGEGLGRGGQGGCDRRIEVFGKIHKRKIQGGGGGSVWGVWVDVNEELKFS